MLALLDPQLQRRHEHLAAFDTRHTRRPDLHTMQYDLGLLRVLVILEVFDRGEVVQRREEGIYPVGIASEF